MYYTKNLLSSKTWKYDYYVFAIIQVLAHWYQILKVLSRKWVGAKRFHDMIGSYPKYDLNSSLSDIHKMHVY